MLRRHFIALLLPIAGCSPYHALTSDGEGYAEYPYLQGQHLIEFTGNEATPGAEAIRFARVRAAEISRQSGFPAFIVLDQTLRFKVIDRRVVDGHSEIDPSSTNDDPRYIWVPEKPHYVLETRPAVVFIFQPVPLATPEAIFASKYPAP